NVDTNLGNRRLAQPVLHLAGENDHEYPPELLYKAMPHIHTSIVVQVPDAKSLVHVDNPQYTVQRISTFIKQGTQLGSVLAKEATIYYDTLTERSNEQRNEYHLRVDVIRR